MCVVAVSLVPRTWMQCLARLVASCYSRTLALLWTLWTRLWSRLPTTYLQSSRKWRCSWLWTTGNRSSTVLSGVPEFPATTFGFCLTGLCFWSYSTFGQVSEKECGRFPSKLQHLNNRGCLKDLRIDCHYCCVLRTSRELEATNGAAMHNLDDNIHDDLSSLDLGIYEARDLVQNRPLWRLMSLHSALVVLHATVGLFFPVFLCKTISMCTYLCRSYRWRMVTVLYFLKEIFVYNLEQTPCCAWFFLSLHIVSLWICW